MSWFICTLQCHIFFYWDKVLHCTPSTLFEHSRQALFLFQQPSQYLQCCLQGLTSPPRAASLCCDAWPLPLGSWLALQQSSRGRAKEGKGWGWQQRDEEAREQNTKFHLFWVGWLIFLAWREQLWIQFMLLANCVPESLVGLGKKMNGKWLTSFTVGHVSAGLTLAGMVLFGLRGVNNGCWEKKKKWGQWRNPFKTNHSIF